MSPPPPSRRALLKRGLAVAAAGGLAGCGADSLPFGGDSGEDLPPMRWGNRCYQYDRGHTGVETDMTGLPEGAEVYWRHGTVEGIKPDTMPLLSGDLFVQAGLGLSAFDPQNDEQVWRRGLGRAASSPTFAADRIFVGGAGLYAFDVDSREQRWHTKLYHHFTAPVEREGVVYASSTPNGTVREDDYEGVVWAFDLGIGSERWSYPMAAEPDMPALGDDAVFVVAKEPDEVHAVDTETGEGLWVEEVGAHGVPTVRDGRVYVGTDGGVTALDAATGDQLWHESLDGMVCRSVAATGDTVYATHRKPGGVVAIDAAEGSIEWAQDHDHPGGTPVVVGGHVYTGSEIGARCFDADDGTEVWTVDPAPDADADEDATEVVSVPLVFDEIAFVVTGTGDVCALGPPEGWTEVAQF